MSRAKLGIALIDNCPLIICSARAKLAPRKAEKKQNAIKKSLTKYCRWTVRRARRGKWIDFYLLHSQFIIISRELINEGSKSHFMKTLWKRILPRNSWRWFEEENKFKSWITFRWSDRDLAVLFSEVMSSIQQLHCRSVSAKISRIFTASLWSRCDFPLILFSLVLAVLQNQIVRSRKEPTICELLIADSFSRGIACAKAPHSATIRLKRNLNF